MTEEEILDRVDAAHHEVVPSYKYRAVRAVLAEREAELLELKGPCSSKECTLHYAHRGPCDIKRGGRQ